MTSLNAGNYLKWPYGNLPADNDITYERLAEMEARRQHIVECDYCGSRYIANLLYCRNCGAPMKVNNGHTG